MVPPKYTEYPKHDPYSLLFDNYNPPSETNFFLFNFKLYRVQMIIYRMYLQLYNVLTLIKNQLDFLQKQNFIREYKTFFHLKLYMGAKIKYIQKTYSCQCAGTFNLQIMPKSMEKVLFGLKSLLQKVYFDFLSHVFLHYSRNHVLKLKCF